MSFSSPQKMKMWQQIQARPPYFPSPVLRERWREKKRERERKREKERGRGTERERRGGIGRKPRQVIGHRWLEEKEW